MAFQKTVTLLRALLGRGYRGSGHRFRGSLSTGHDTVPYLVSGGVGQKQMLILSTGFGSRLTDYAPLVELLEERFLVVRVVHPGSLRASAMLALAILWREKVLFGKSWREAALRARSWLHRRTNYERRAQHLLAVCRHFQHRYPAHSLSLAGHSFGTDSALRCALEVSLENLYLFSPHPPGYLFATEAYERLKAKKVWLVTGSRDFTRDGVGPQERLEVMSHLPRPQAEAVVLEGVGHMSFAFSELGPPGWPPQLAERLGL